MGLLYTKSGLHIHPHIVSGTYEGAFAIQHEKLNTLYLSSEELDELSCIIASVVEYYLKSKKLI